ncbi:WecB/TagA/CpsF family glycosyltransferase [Peribacillus kribbensis]|uniref:WecB/TagA/CpsF family glycosyltransferase n=1 Tax=Peribacillus kribbensis TaxID=356658 RepID=UPI000420F693|nr:WecB/TagA/CpsF family glycosyltransferase [Peribacillus kribbensis]
MDAHRVTILDIPFIGGTREQFIQKELLPRIEHKEKCFIVTANPEIVEFAVSDEDYKKLVLSADFVVPDGIGIIVASKMIGQPLEERITGFDILNDLLALADRKSLSVYMLGAQEHVIQKAAWKVKELYPHLKLAGFHHGFFNLEDDSFAREIAELKPDLIFVATGAPRQEKWIAAHMDKFDKGIFMGVGGCFDILAGEVKGAPESWKRLHAEWLYRLLRQPTRWKRMLAIPRFLLRVAKNRP